MDSEKILAEVYDLIPLYRDREDKAFYRNMASGMEHVLEIGCGTGRILCEVQKNAKLIDGVDISKEKLEVCRQKLTKLDTEKQEKIILYCGNILEKNIETKYDLILLPFRVFQYITELSDEEQMLKWIYDHLLLNGRVIIDCFNTNLNVLVNYEQMKDIEDSFEYEDYTVHRECTIDWVDRGKQQMMCHMHYVMKNKNGECQEILEKIHYRYYFRYELQLMLEKCNFTIEEMYGGYNGEEFGEDSKEMIYIAKRK